MQNLPNRTLSNFVFNKYPFDVFLQCFITLSKGRRAQFTLSFFDICIFDKSYALIKNEMSDSVCEDGHLHKIVRKISIISESHFIIQRDFVFDFGALGFDFTCVIKVWKMGNSDKLLMKKKKFAEIGNHQVSITYSQ